MSSKINLAFVAREAGVAVSTASLVLNGKAASVGLAEETVMRIKLTAERYGYTPNQNARSLRLRRSGMLGLILAGLSKISEQMLRSVRQVLDGSGREIVPLLASHDYVSEREHKELRFLMRNQVEAIIATPIGPWAKNYEPLIATGVPVVFAVHGVADAPETISGVFLDSEGMAREGVRHLVAGGARRIAYLNWDYGTPVSQEKMTGVQQAVMEARGRTSLAGIFSQPPGTHFEASLATLFANPKNAPDALLCNPSSVAMRCLDFLDRKKIPVPGKCALLSLNDHEMFNHNRLRVTAVMQDNEFIGRRAAQIALGLIAAKKTRVVRERHACFQLIQRETTRPTA
jgi:DNA-binding LacI/PurR family transcriptional regulator